MPFKVIVCGRSYIYSNHKINETRGLSVVFVVLVMKWLQDSSQMTLSSVGNKSHSLTALILKAPLTCCLQLVSLMGTVSWKNT